MGILDEAIREHIDLKRKHGAAESEVRKLEDDAFGLPVRPGGKPRSIAPRRRGWTGWRPGYAVR